jgi:hypothetical protein
MCARKAFWGNTAFANDWQWVFGVPLVSGLLGYFASRKGTSELSTGYPILDGVLTALGAFVVTWCVAFLVRLFDAPAVLFQQQKDRADALDGTPIVKLRSRDKKLLNLRARYLSKNPPAEREFLDFLVDGLQSFEDVTFIFNSLGALLNKLTKAVPRHTRRLMSAKAFEKQRKVVSEVAADLSSHSERFEEYIEVLRAITPTMFECTSNFIKRSQSPTKDDVANFTKAIEGNIDSCNASIQHITSHLGTLKSFMGISADLNAATARYVSINTLLVREITEYKAACEELRTLSEGKVTAA